MSTIVEKLTASLKALPANVDASIPIMNITAILTSEEETSDEELLNLMIEKKLMSNLRNAMIWHIAVNCIEELDVKCIAKMRDSKFNFRAAVTKTLDQLRGDDSEIVESKIDAKELPRPVKLQVARPVIETHASNPNAISPEDSEEKPWKAVVGTKKAAVAATKKLVAQRADNQGIVPKSVGSPAKWIKPNNKPENGLECKYIASAGYVLFPSRPPRIQNSDMFSWFAVDRVVIGGNDVLVPWRKGYERNAGWEFLQSKTSDQEYIGWYRVSDEFKYCHYLNEDGCWEHYYVDSENAKDIQITEEEMYSVVTRNLWKNDRE